MTKPRILAAAIGAAGLMVLLGATGAGGVLRWALIWIGLACGVASFAYLTNQPSWIGKREGRLVWWRVLPVAPYVLAYGIAAWVRRARRRYAAWDEIAPRVFVGARLPAAELPRGAQWVVDLTAELPEIADVRRLAGYRSLPALDGATPPDEERFLGLLEELSEAEGGVYLHCISGRGRAPTAAAALLIARGVAPDAPTAFEIVRKGRPASAPNATDVAFVERISTRLR
ncbi:MAG: hypothetical protein ACR2P8_16200 [Myxococcota bacterium]